ncbi:DUF2683 family protein [Owenweeksia hongkongensis]|uniref:DUF2683 family protein n=1 Tax=Owenweeksia hongkongensis TaxID=253245 RepID=UPI0002DDA685|nr:DUF2683 family protein [Owenweeksia hongkongensis]
MKTENTFIIHPETKEQENALKAFIKALKMKFEISERKTYDSEFVAKVEEIRNQAYEGKTTKVDKDDLKEFLGL